METKRRMRWMSLAATIALLVAGWASAGVAGREHADPGDPDDPVTGVVDEPRQDPVPPRCVFFEEGKEDQDRDQDRVRELCPEPAPRGATCVSHALVVVERESSGLVGDVEVFDSTSSATTHGTSARFSPNPWDLAPPKRPDANAKANKLDAGYDQAFVSADASTIDSRCDAKAVEGEDPRAAAFGQAGVTEATIDILGTTVLDANVLEYTVDAAREEQAQAAQHCRLADLSTRLVSINDPGHLLPTDPTDTEECSSPNTGVSWNPTLNLPGASTGPVTVTLNEQWGSINHDGNAYYGGAAAHVQATLGASTVDIYVGYVAVAV